MATNNSSRLISYQLYIQREKKKKKELRLQLLFEKMSGKDFSLTSLSHMSIFRQEMWQYDWPVPP